MAFYFKASTANSWIRVIICSLIPLLFYNKRRNRRFIKHRFHYHRYIDNASYFCSCYCHFKYCYLYLYIYSGYHFYKNVFTDQGYLTNTLPVTPSQLLLSKELAALLWLLIDVVVISISIFILVGSTELFSNFSIFWRTLMRYASQTPLFTTLVIIALVLAPFLLIDILFFSITLGNLASSHKVLASIGAYVGIYVVQQIFGLIQLVVWGYFGSTTIMRVNIYSNNYFFKTFLNPILITGLIFNIILIAVCWMGSKYIMTKRLNLQ